MIITTKPHKTIKLILIGLKVLYKYTNRFFSTKHRMYIKQKKQTESCDIVTFFYQKNTGLYYIGLDTCIYSI